MIYYAQPVRSSLASKLRLNALLWRQPDDRESCRFILERSELSFQRAPFRDSSTRDREELGGLSGGVFGRTGGQGLNRGGIATPTEAMMSKLEGCYSASTNGTILRPSRKAKMSPTADRACSGAADCMESVGEKPRMRVLLV